MTSFMEFMVFIVGLAGIGTVAAFALGCGNELAPYGMLLL